MIRPSYQYLFRACLVIIVGLWFIFPKEFAAQSKPRFAYQVVKWSVRIYPEDTTSIEVVIDSRGIGQAIRNVSYEVSFYTEQNKFLGKKTFYTETKELEPEKYVIYESIPYGAAKLVKGRKIKYITRELGSLYSCTDCPLRPELEYDDEAVEWDESEASQKDQQR